MFPSVHTASEGLSHLPANCLISSHTLPCQEVGDEAPFIFCVTLTMTCSQYTQIVTIGLHSSRRYVGLPHLFLLLFPSLKPCTIRSSDFVRYDTISCWWRLSCVRYDLVSAVLYDINLGATTTTILGTGGVTLPIDLVSSTTDSIWVARSTI